MLKNSRTLWNRRFTKSVRSVSRGPATPELLESRQLLAIGVGITSPELAMFGALSRGGLPAGIAYNNTLTANANRPSVAAPPIAAAVPPATTSLINTLSADTTDVASIRLEVVDLNGNPIASITQGSQFQLRGYVRDLHTQDPRVIQAFVDVAYNSALAAPVGNVTIGNSFPNSVSGVTPGTGLLDEVGGVASTAIAGSNEVLLFSVTMQATGPGLLTFTSDAADDLPAHNLVTDSVVPAANIDFGTSQVVVQPTGDRDLVAFAKALATANAKLYGASWSAQTTAQKELFEDGASFLSFVEVTDSKRVPTSVAAEKNITTYPTWIFADGSRLAGLQTLEAISAKSGIPIPTSITPSLAPIGTKAVLAGSPLLVPLDGYDPNGGPLTYTVSSDNPSVVAPTLFTGDRSMRISVEGFGDMVFELFEGRVPRVTQHIISLAQSGFYDGVTFHRILNNFVIQGGDPLGTGSGGSNLGDFDDQFDVDLQHNQTGILSMAKSNDDTNDSQFFITETPQRHLDFNHSIFGYLVEGESVRDNISNVDASTSGTPSTKVVMDHVSIFQDTENRVMMLKAPANTTGSANITVTVTDQDGHSTTQTFQVNVTPDTVNADPYLADLPGPFSTTTNTPVDVILQAIDAEGDAADFASISGSNTLNPTITVTNNKVTVTPPTGFAGSLPILVGTYVKGGTTSSSPIDSQLITINVLGVDLLPESDSGSSNSDNITNAANLRIRVGGVPEGAVVKLLHNGTTVGTATATKADDGAIFTYDASGDVDAISFQAEYTLDNVTTPIAQPLNVTIDRVAPVAFTDSSISLGVKAGKTLQYNAQHPAEGNGITYRLVSGPTGSTIDASTGAFTWAAGLDQSGKTISFTIEAADVAGNTASVPVTITVAAPDIKAEFTVVVEDTSGNPLTLIPKDSEFVVKVFVQDTRADVATTDRHVYKAYTDLSYDPTLAAVSGSLVVGPNFAVPSGTNTQAGLIDEAGGTNALVKTDAKMLLLTQHFTATAKGLFTFQTAKAVKLNTSGAATKEHDIGLGFTGTADTREITYGSTQVRITDGFNAFNDTIQLNEDSPTSVIDVLANDSPGATITSVGTTNHGGTVTIAANSLTLNYTPAANYSGPETFTYTISNGASLTDTATVTVTVTSQNDPPTAAPDTFNTDGNASAALFRVQDNDGFAPDTGETLRVTALSSTSAGGTITIATNGLGVRYTPPSSTFVGVDTFTYTISDGNGGTAQALATINVAMAIPLAPDLLAVSDSGKLNNDNITNSNSWQVEVAGGLAGAIMTLFANGNSVGTQNVVDGKALFTVDATALSGDVILTATQTKDNSTSAASAGLTVKIDRTAPTGFTSTPPDVLFAGVAMTYNTQNSEEPNVTYGLVSAPTGMFIDATTGVVTWTPFLGNVGPLAFVITASDVAGNVANHNFTSNVADDEVAFVVQAVDTDGNPISAAGVGSTFQINVYARDIRPFTADALKGVLNAYVDMTFNDDKLDTVGNPILSPIFSDSDTQLGVLSTGRIDSVGGRNSDQKSAAPMLLLSQKFRAIQTGSVTFQTEFAQGQDGSGNPTTTLNVTLADQQTPVPQAAIQFGSTVVDIVAGLAAQSDTYQFTEDVAVQTLNVLSNDTAAPNSGTLTITSVGTSSQGSSISISPDGHSIRYQPAANFFGAELFQYTVTDQAGASSNSTVTVTVLPGNDPPVATADTLNVIQNSAAVEIDVLANDKIEPDIGETLTISAVTQGNQGGTVEIIASSKRLRYTPATNTTGIETFTYTVSDGNGGTALGQVTVNLGIAGPTAIDLLPASDTGSSDTDNVTKGTTLQFRVTGVTPNAEVHILAGTNSVGSAVATGTSVDVNVDANQLTGIIAFTATQTINSNTSVPSPVLNVTIDRTAPNAFQSTPPSVVFVGVPVTYNTANSEEGSITYTLDTAPAGVTINGTTGVLDWNPTVAQVGPQTFNIVATDVAGNSASQPFNSRVIDDEIAVTTRVQDGSGNLLTSIPVGSTFTLEVAVQDLRDFIPAADRGIFNAFVDLDFDSLKLELVGDTVINSVFNDNSSSRAGTRTTGHIDGAGGTNTDQKTGDSVWLLRQQFRALSVGTPTVQTSFAQDFEVNNQPTGNFDLILFGQTVPAPAAAVQYGTASINVVQALRANNDTQQLVQDATTTLDVLANDTAAPNSGALTIEFAGKGTTSGATTAGGTVTITQGGTRISYQPPAGFVGADSFSYRIKDTQNVTSTADVALTITAGAPSGIDLLAASDTGALNTDNITNANQLTFEVTGVQNGAQVQLRANNVAIGSPVVAASGKATISIDASTLTGSVPFTAVQTVNGATSAASSPLNITIDRTAPVAFTTQPPTTATPNVLTTYDVQHPEEGANLKYSLFDAPSGATIDAVTGVLNWTPTLADVGTKSFTIVAADLAGNTVTQPINLVVAGTQVAVTVRLLDSAGNVITKIGKDATFQLEVLVQDTRTGIDNSAKGVTSAFVNLGYDAARVALNGATVVDAIFKDAGERAGDRTTGNIAGIGGLNNDQKSSATMRLFTQSFKASEIGTATFTTDFATGSNVAMKVTDQTTAIPKAAIQFGTASLTIEEGLVANSDSATVGQDSAAITLDLLANDSAGPGSTGLVITQLGSTNHNGTVTIINSGKQVSYKPAAGFFGTETFTYTVSDGTGATRQQTVTVTINQATSVAGSIFFDSNNNGVKDGTERGLANVEVKLDGTTTSGGQAVHLTQRTDSNGAYKFTSLAPGQYSVTHAQPGLVVNGSTANSVYNVTTTLANPTVTTGNFTKATMAPQFAMLYALSKTPANPMEVASSTSGQTQWQLVDTAWAQFTSTEVALSSDHQSITVRVTKPNGDQLTDTVSATNRALVQVLGESNGILLFRIVGKPTDFNFKAVTSTASQAASARIDQIFASGGV